MKLSLRKIIALFFNIQFYNALWGVFLEDSTIKREWITFQDGTKKRNHLFDNLLKFGLTQKRK